MDIGTKLPSYLILLGMLVGFLRMVPAWPLLETERDNKRKGKKQTRGRLIEVIAWTGAILALVGMFVLLANNCGNNCGQ